jgi:4-hydroxyacetophenone monooxygenase
VPFYVNFARFRMGRLNGPDNSKEILWVDPDFVDPHARSPMNKAMRESCLAFIHEKLAGRPDLIEKMTPTAPPMTSRPIRVDPDDNVYTALLRDNVTLVTDPITRITPKGIEVGGQEYEFDVIALATGFKANDFLWPMEVRGRDGVRVETLWAKDGPRAYIGSMLPGFPNFFMAYGPNTNNFGGLQVIDLLEIVIRFALQCIAGLIESDKRSVDVTRDAYWHFNQELDNVESHMIYMDPRAFNYYRNEHGRSSVNGPIDIRRMWNWLRDPAGQPSQPLDAGIKPWFGEDLTVT